MDVWTLLAGTRIPWPGLAGGFEVGLDGVGVEVVGGAEVGAEVDMLT